MLAAWGWTRSALSIVVTDDDEVRALNVRWRGLDRTTDVLSFPMDERAPAGPGEAAAPPILGDVVISLEQAARQAPRRRRGLDAELACLLAHGFLHLAGWDHARPAGRRAMRAMERRLCAVSALR